MRPEILNSAEVIIVGAGAAGLFTALSLSPKRVIVLNEKPLGGICASQWAQGGIAAAVDKEDSVSSHAADTLKAAAGTAEKDVVRRLTAEAPEYIKLLEKIGVRFDRDDAGSFKLSHEACHGRRRVLKAATGDGFGYELMRGLVEAVKRTPSILFIENVSAERIIYQDNIVKGILARQNGKPVIFAAPVVVLATGGIGGLYSSTTNPLGAVGRGIAIAAHAGAVLSDLEFVQFHPTALDIGEDPAPLATEALRGEGATLLNSRGERFMLDYHEMAEMAPRDIVSRAMFAQIRQGRKTYLDCRKVDVSHFPALTGACARAGIDPKRDLVPVIPAAHYHMGGVATDLHGRTSIAGLWACGEVASTGLHGANRLASNSLMEAIVMGGRAAADISRFTFEKHPIDIEALPALPQVYNMEAQKDVLRHLMTEYVGVTRNAQGLNEALQEISYIAQKAEKLDTRLADMANVARLITLSALARTESRGGHCRSDHPHPAREWQKRSFITLDEAEVSKKLEDVA